MKPDTLDKVFGVLFAALAIVYALMAWTTGSNLPLIAGLVCIMMFAFTWNEQRHRSPSY